MVHVGEHTLKINQNGLKEVAFTHRATLALGCRRYGDSTVTKGDSAPFPTNDLVNRDRYLSRMNVVDEIILHTGKRASLRYVVRGYGYTETDDTSEPPHCIPQQFIDD